MLCAKLFEGSDTRVARLLLNQALARSKRGRVPPTMLDGATIHEERDSIEERSPPCSRTARERELIRMERDDR